MRINPVIYLMALNFLMVSCNQKQDADFIVTNAKVYTVNDAFSIANSFAVKEGRFIAVGNEQDILKDYLSSNIIDAKGKPVFPGFIDGHCHFFSYGMGLRGYADLRGTTSFDEILGILKKYHEQHPGEWILGRGWDQNNWVIKAFPDNKLLNHEFPGVPVVLVRVDGHAILASTEALRIAGINENMQVSGGEILKKNGILTGILVDNAIDRVMDAIPKPNELQKQNALLKAQNNCFQVGLTSVVDAGLIYQNIYLIDSLQKANTLKIRVNAMLNPTAENFRNFMDKGRYQTDRLTVGSAKLYADGALGSRGALLLQPYTDDPTNQGMQVNSTEYLRSVLKRIYDAGYQANTHCIGDSAVRLMLGLYGELLKGNNDRRWRIEHAQVVDPSDLSKFKAYSVIPSIQSTHCTSDMAWAIDRLGPVRIRNAYIAKQLLEQNGWLVNGTDFPVEEINPICTFYAAVVRKDLHGNPPSGFQIENALSREQALKSMTIWAAKGSFEESLKGSIEPGKFADFVILDEDIMTVDPGKIPNVKVLKTFLNGEEVYNRTE